MNETSHFFTDQAGHKIAAILTVPSSPTDRVALLCHGFLSSKNSSTNKALTRLLIERHIATFRFDFFGQGESEGPFEDITVGLALDQAKAALAWAAARGFRRLGLVGSSFGGLIALLAASEAASSEPALRCLALKCPVPDFPSMLQLEFGSDGLDEWRRSNTMPDVTGGSGRIRLRYRFYEECRLYDGYCAATGIAVPTLIVHGDRDELVPVQQSERLLDSLSGPKHLLVVPGADHGFTAGEHFTAMTRAIAEWMVRHLS
ncbi:Alpha/beta hydrolase [Nitrospira tepida]|uniref:Alpha/beta hydrolase n=1 Tax=Nitrospira tepida TaxID=2973512 RepID=A0AA86MXZ5_9BACT|nr:alpha/beta hydrolase [Nitrospira tepida]CAI4031079.1 Alpha/beta hydrolase [Nitrospira tepida]